MIKLNLKDRKILYELDKNSRQSYSKIAKKTNMSKDIVQYRINKLIEKGIISGFYTRINSFKLGYNSIRFYLIFQNITPEIKKKIIEYYSNNKYILNCASIEGRYDLVVNMWVKNLDDFYTMWEKGLAKYRKYIHQEIFSIYIEAMDFGYSYLLKEKYKKTDIKKIETIKVSKTKIEIDEIDWEILWLLADNTRISLNEVARKLKSSARTVNSRIKKLQKMGIIVDFKIGINLQKIGYTRFKVDFFLNDYTKKYQILNYIKYNPHLVWASKSIGISDLELEFDVENLEQLHEILQDLSVKFPNIIRSYRYFNIIKRHILKLIPGKV